MSDKQRKCLSRSAYSIGWICALPLELAASVGMFDETHQDLDLARGDRNMYTLGEMAGHNIVMACLPAGSTGVTPAATVAANMLRSFPKIRFGLMVGIGGGAPARRARPHEDIRLGDVVVSIPQGELGGVVKYDCGKTVAGGAFEHTGLLNMPPAPLANAVAKLRGMHEAKRSAVSRYVTTMINKVMAGEDANPEFEELYRCPDPKYDQLFAAEYEHTTVPVPPSQEESDDDERFSSEDEDDIPLPCPHCDPARLVQRKPRKHPGPVIHYGTIASADQVMRHALTRDAIRKKHGILCFDMEAAGLMNDFPCLVVRGICDYADTHKHKIWQRYAAATAAAYTKELLQVVLREEVQTTEEVVKILERVEYSARDIKQNVDRLAKDKARQDRDRILNWLDSDTHTKRLLDSYEKWQPSTVRKLFESEAYRDWTLGEAQTLWCPGIAGGGKTVFSSVVVRSLKAGQEAQPDASRAAVICLFCEYERQKEQTLRTLAAAMLRQLADQCELLPDELVDLFEKHGTGASSHLRFEDISLALTRVLKEFPRVYLIVDALDECSDQTRRELLAQLAEQQRKTGLRILATARPTVEFEKEFGTKYQVLEIRADVLDVKSVLDALIDKSNSFVREDEELRRRVTDTIAFAVDGMFLLAQPFHDSVIGERSRGHVEDALQTLMDSPDKLATVYENALGRIGGQKPGDRNLAHRMLSWVVESKRPLTRDEFLHALAIQTGRPQFQRHYMIENLDGAVALCAGLVVINERSDTVQLMHHTARTYLEDPERRPGWMAGSREMIASACVTYISYSVFEDGPCRGDEEMGRRLDDYPFLPYAAQHWGHHGHDAGGETESMQHLALHLLLNQGKLASANQAMQCTGRRYSGYSSWYDREVTALHVVAAFGLPNTTGLLLAATGADAIDVRDGDGRTALHRAAENGHEAVIRILLGHSADVVAEEGTFGQTPLHLAALNGREAATRVLMEHGASSLARDADGWMPIHTASWMGHADVVRALLVTPDAVHALSGDGLTALHCAAAQGHAELARLLIRNGADVNAEDDEAWTPLHWASKKRHDVLKPRVLSLQDETSALLRRFVELQEEMNEVIHQQAGVLQDRLATALSKPLDFWQNRLAWLPSGALELKMSHEYGEVVAALQMSTNVQSVTLPWSVWNMMEGTGEGPHGQGGSEAREEEEDEPAKVRFMFAIQDELTAMHCTTACGHAEVSRLLVRHGADVEARCHTTIETKFLTKVEIKTTCTALHLAAFSSHEAMVSILLEQGADIRARTASCTETQGVEYVRPKPTKNFDIFARPDVEWTPLHCGVVSGSEDVVQMLLDKGAGVQETGFVNFFMLKCELTALHMAVALGYVDKARLLLAGGADVNAQGWIDLDVPLNYHASVEKTLPLRIDATSLQIATLCRRTAAIQLLLDQGADATAKILVRVEEDEDNGAELNGLHLMALFRDWRLADSLVKAGADVNDELRIDVKFHKTWKLGDLEQGGPDDKHGRDKEREEGVDMDPIHSFFTRTARNFVGLLGEQLEDASMFGSISQTLERQEKETSYHAKVRSTALSLAILAANEQVIQVLIDNGADIHAASIFAVGSSHVQCQPLHLAVLCGAEATVAHLIDAGADTSAHLAIQVGEQIRVCLSPLHLACLFGHETLVGLLLERGADARALCRVNDDDENVVSALHLAALLGQETIVLALVDSKSDASQRCRLLLRPKIDMDMDLSALHLAALSGNVHVVEALLDTDHDSQHLARLDCHKMHATFTVLHLAALWGHEQVVSHLLEKGHDVQTPCVIDIQSMSHVELTCLHLAAFAGGLDMMTSLLDAGANVHQIAVIDGPAFRTKLTALHITALARHRDVMEMLIHLDMDIHLPIQADFWDEMHVELSLLHIAALWRVQVTQLLLDKGFDVNARLVIHGPETHAEIAALHMAAALDKKRLALLLLDREADPDARALVVTDDVNVDMTALHMALGRMSDDMVHLLVSKRPLLQEEHAWLASDADSDCSSLLSEDSKSNSNFSYDSSYIRASNRSSPRRSYFSPRADSDSQSETSTHSTSSPSPSPSPSPHAGRSRSRTRVRDYMSAGMVSAATAAFRSRKQHQVPPTSPPPADSRARAPSPSRSRSRSESPAPLTSILAGTAGVVLASLGRRNRKHSHRRPRARGRSRSHSQRARPRSRGRFGHGPRPTPGTHQVQPGFAESVHSLSESELRDRLGRLPRSRSVSRTRRSPPPSQAPRRRHTGPSLPHRRRRQWRRPRRQRRSPPRRRVGRRSLKPRFQVGRVTSMLNRHIFHPLLERMDKVMDRRTEAREDGSETMTDGLEQTVHQGRESRGDKGAAPIVHPREPTQGSDGPPSPSAAGQEAQQAQEARLTHETLPERTNLADPNAMLLLNVGDTRIQLTALHLSAMLKASTISELLLGDDNINTDPNSLLKVKSHGNALQLTPLHVAILRRSKIDMQHLARRGADLESLLDLDVGGLYAKLSPLQLATIVRSWDIAQTLLGNHADAHARHTLGIRRDFQTEVTPLHVLLFSEQGDVPGLASMRSKVSATIELRMETDISALDAAAGMNQASMIALFSDYEFHVAAASSPKTGWLRILALMIASASGIDMLGQAGLLYLREVDDKTAVTVGVQMDAYFSSTVTMSLTFEALATILHVACALGNTSMTRALIAKGASVESRCDMNAGDTMQAYLTPLHLAVLGRHSRTAYCLLQHDASLSASAEFHVERTVRGDVLAPHLAEWLGNNAVSRLVEKAAGTVRIKVKGDLAAIHLVALTGDQETMLTLLNHDTTVDSPCSAHLEAKTASKHELDLHVNLQSQLTPLHLAVAVGRAHLIPLLVQSGDNVEGPIKVSGITTVERGGARVKRTVDATGTALHLAAALGNMQTIHALLDNGANVHAKSDNGRTAYEWAKTRGHEDAARVLREHEQRDGANDDGKQRRLLLKQRWHDVFSRGTLHTSGTVEGQQSFVHLDREEESSQQDTFRPNGVAGMIARWVTQRAKDRRDKANKDRLSSATDDEQDVD